MWPTETRLLALWQHAREIAAQKKIEIQELQAREIAAQDWGGFAGEIAAPRWGGSVGGVGLLRAGFCASVPSGSSTGWRFNGWPATRPLDQCPKPRSTHPNLPEPCLIPLDTYRIAGMVKSTDEQEQMKHVSNSVRPAEAWRG